MWHTKQASPRRRRNKAAPILGAAGLSLSLASGAAAATGAVPAAAPTHKTLTGHQVTMADEEISDVSLATFYVFDKEDAAPPRRGMRLAIGGCGACGCGCGCYSCGACWGGNYYTGPVFGEPSYPPPPAYRPRTHRHRQTSKNK